jgi:carboxymethylenebutenolidase
MGGGLALALASHAAKLGKPIQAAISCYGTAPAFDMSLIGKETAVQGHFGGKVIEYSVSLCKKIKYHLSFFLI